MKKKNVQDPFQNIHQILKQIEDFNENYTPNQAIYCYARSFFLLFYESNTSNTKQFE